MKKMRNLVVLSWPQDLHQLQDYQQTNNPHHKEKIDLNLNSEIHLEIK